MKQKRKKNIQLAVRFMVPMLLITILQCGVFLFAVKMFGADNNTQDTAYRNFYTTAKAQGEKISGMFSGITENSAFAKLSAESASLAENGGEFSADAVKSLEALMQCGKGSGAFIILEQDKETGYGAALYLREDLNQNGVVLCAGSKQAAIAAGVEKVSDSWLKNITVTDEPEYDFYNNVKLDFIQSKQTASSGLARLEKSARLFGADNYILTYAVPISDENGNFLGVAGIEYNKEKINEMLPYSGLTQAGQGIYVLGTLNKEDNTVTVSAQNGQLFSVFNENGALSLDGEYIFGDLLFRQKNKGTLTNTVMAVVPVSLLKEENGCTVLCAAAEKNSIIEAAYSLRKALLTAAIISLVLCGAGVAIAAYCYNRPINRLVNTLRSYSPESDEKLVLQPSGIREIDRLQDIIESLNENITYTAGRLSQILELSNIPLGAIEYDYRTDVVYCTENVPKLLYFDKGERPSYRYSLNEFKEKIDKFLLHTKPYRSADDDGENTDSLTLQFTDDHGVSSWINFHTTLNGNKKICVVQDISETVREKIKLEYERDYDALTNLLNRRSFKKQVKEILENPKRVNIGAMIMWDMDNLKYINDTYGHDSGDRYLADAAKLFSTLSGCRGVVARMSGDEFFAFLYGFKTRKELQTTVERLHNRLKQTSFTTPDGELMPIRASGGMAWYPENGKEYDELVQHADFAMYHSKHTRRGELVEFNEQAFEKESVLLSGSELLNRFIEKRMAEFSFQPIVDLKTAKVFAYESFIMPTCSELPTMFDVMRLARAQSKLYQIELLTMFGTYEAAQKYSAEIGGAKIFVSSIPNTQLKDQDITRIEESYAECTGRIVLQITENEQADKLCMEHKRSFCRKNGAQIAVNNFGSGYSSEASLLMIAPDYVKLDSHIIKKINLDENRQKLLESIILCTKKLNMKTIAVGVETQAELEYLCRLGIDYAQGDIFGAPSVVPEQPKTLARETLLRINGFDFEESIAEENSVNGTPD